MKLHVESRPGVGRELVMIHGLTRRWQTFSPLLPGLAQRYSVVLVDLPGHGVSEANTSGYLVRDFAEAMLQWLDQHPTERVSVYGHSLGAMVTMELAARRPERIASVILEDPPFHTMGNRISSTVWLSYFSQVKHLRNDDRFLDGTRKEQVAMLAEIVLVDPKTGATQRLGDQRDQASLRFMAECVLQMRSEVLHPVVEGRWLEGWDWEEVSAGITMPACILQADERTGGMLTQEDCRKLVMKMSDAVPVFFEKSGHNLHWLRTQDVLNCVYTFLDS
jgi:pimeloyl-ACP methyl ester carboxylesterase